MKIGDVSAANCKRMLDEARSWLHAPASILAAFTLVVASGALVAQSALTPFAVTEASARKLLTDALPSGGRPFASSPFVAVISNGLDRLPPAARGPATTAAFGWAKQFVASPAFRTAYTAARDGQKPGRDPNPLSVDEEVKKTIDDSVAAFETGKQMLAALPEAERTKALAQMKAELDQMRSPEKMKTLRSVIEAKQASANTQNATAMAQWQALFPPEPERFVKRVLEEFLAMTENLDFTVPTFFVKGPKGETVGFFSPGYTGLDWQKEHAIVAGKEAVTAARLAAQTWVKEIGR